MDDIKPNCTRYSHLGFVDGEPNEVLLIEDEENFRKRQELQIRIYRNRQRQINDPQSAKTHEHVVNNLLAEYQSLLGNI